MPDMDRESDPGNNQQSNGGSHITSNGEYSTYLSMFLHECDTIDRNVLVYPYRCVYISVFKFNYHIQMTKLIQFYFFFFTIISI